MTRVRTRIAPSPTGYLHVGTARAALFNELFAHGRGGQLIVRLEDTDRKRSRPEFEQSILEGLKWLGLTWEEGPDIGGPLGPYRQSERTSFYQAAIRKLLDNGAAYQQEESEAVRLKVTPQEITFKDAIRGPVAIHTDAWGGDFIIARSLTDPLFHLAVVVDDGAMEITHVIRGEDHLSNTARHILLQRALGLPQPQYAHLPLLLDDKRRKLSKRAGEISLLAYQEKGYLPEAMLNYLALLGWNPKDDSEFFTHAELRERFSLEGVQKAGAFFSEVKLEAVNKHYIRQLTPDELLERAQPFLEKAGYTLSKAAVATEQERIGTLAELPEKLAYFKPDWPADYRPELLIWKKSTSAATLKILQELAGFLADLPGDNFTQDKLEERLMAWIAENEQGRGDVLWPLRVALTGLPHSPGPFEVAAVLGREATLDRLKKAVRSIIGI